MGVAMHVTLDGLGCRLVHEPSGAVIETTPPKDNGGDGTRFSPTDLVAAALASCALTTMALLAPKAGIDLGQATARVEKEMIGPPRRIGSLAVVMTLPARLSEAHRARLEDIARSCPVARSLHAELQVPMRFVYA